MSVQGQAAAGAAIPARLPQLVTILAAAALAAQLATMVWQFAPGTRRPPPAAPVAATQAPADLGGLTGAHLFGNAGADPGAGVDAPRTNVALSLIHI